MDTVLNILFNRAGHLFARAGGPLNFRPVVMPIVVAVCCAFCSAKTSF